MKYNIENVELFKNLWLFWFNLILDKKYGVDSIFIYVVLDKNIKCFF